MFYVLVAAAMALGLPGPAAAAAATGDRTASLPFQGRIRHYQVHIPPSPIGARALVLVFHGGGQTPEQIRRITLFDSIADRERFIVVYPEAFEGSWADGRYETAAEQQGVDDVGFAKAIVEDVSRSHALDRNRIYATGFSNGGMFTHRLACEAAGTFAAIAPVAAAMPVKLAATCRPASPVSVLAIQGRDDPSVHFGGGPVGDRPGSPLLGSRVTEALWQSLNGCPAAVDASPLDAAQDGTRIERRVYMNCHGNAGMLWYEIQGGGHRWPPHQEANEVLARQENGVSSRNLNASEAIWKFFESHRKP